MKNLKKLTRNELKSLEGGIVKPDVECGCVQAGCSSSSNRDGSARCGGSCC
ncbi:bacteriocin-like protein [Chryseobacterium artocarpi]|uniref:bacteriocin-like protein n=1 Tax=Chryseobacterium artocarpi TaxID=1414727 RepID=UPI0013F4E378|nr:hypothetical protein [Chryseobacterium artocarpi]